MSDDYGEMWAGPGLELEAHDALLKALCSAYQDALPSQSDRPRGYGASTS